MLWAINFNNSRSPPGYCGITSTTVKVSSFISSTGLFKRNVIGTVYFTATAFPRCIPGFQRGIVFITLTASSFNKGVTPRSTSGLLTEPSRPTINEQITRPCSPLSWLSFGYFIFVAMYFNNSASPPGKLGIFSTTVNTCSFISRDLEDKDKWVLFVISAAKTSWDSLPW